MINMNNISLLHKNTMSIKQIEHIYKRIHSGLRHVPKYRCIYRDVHFIQIQLNTLDLIHGTGLCC